MVPSLAAGEIVGVEVWMMAREKIRKVKVKPSAWKLLGKEKLIWEAPPPLPLLPPIFHVLIVKAPAGII